MSDTTDVSHPASASMLPTDPRAQALLGGSLMMALIFVLAGGYLLFILAGLLMPWLTAAYVASRRDEAQLFSPSTGGRDLAGLGGLSLYPAMAFRALFDTDFDETVIGITLPCLVLAGVCAGAWLWADPLARTTRPLVMGALALQALAWGVGAGVFVNVRFDRSTPEVVQARVVDASRWKSKRAALPTYGLTFERYGTVTVPEDVFGMLPVGSLACVQRHNGRLGMTWLSVERCPRQPRAARAPAR